MTILHSIRKAPMAVAAVLVTGLLLSQSAAAGIAGGWTRSSTVNDSVVNNGGGTWSYNYTVNNTSVFSSAGAERGEPILVDWELPWFGDAGITNIRSPRNWTHSIETIGIGNDNPLTGWQGVAAWQDPADPFYAGATSPFTNVTQVLHWYNVCWARGANVNTFAAGPLAADACEGQFDNAIFVGGSLDGFGFDAAFDATAAPYQASWAVLPVRSGDPAFPLGGIPNSPAVQGVPEPGALGLLGAGLLALVWSRRRRV